MRERSGPLHLGAGIVLATVLLLLSAPGPSFSQLASTGVIRPVSAVANDEYPGHPVVHLWDGNLETKWAARPDGEGKNTVVFDFGLEAELTGVTIHHAEDGGEGINLNTEDFRMETGPSPDGPWTLLFQVVDNLGGRTTRTFDPVRTRYVRLVVDDAMSMNQANEKNDDNIARIPEIEFMGGAVGGAVSAAPSVLATTAPPVPGPSGASPPFLRYSGGEAPSPLAGVSGGQSAPSSAAPAAGASSFPSPPPAIVPRGGAAGLPAGQVANDVAASVSAASPWMTDIDRAGQLATQRRKTILVFFRSDASRHQAAADAVLLDASLITLLQKNNILLVVDMKARPQDGARFGVIRAPTLAQWTADGKELARLWGDEITYKNATTRFRL